MNNDTDFFTTLFKAGVKLISETTEEENESIEQGLKLEKNDNEWRQEYELIYQSYSVD